jgi:hypothetical protein
MSAPGVVLVARQGSFSPAGRQLTGPVDSVDKLEKLICWAVGKGFLEPSGHDPSDAGQRSPARVWVVGEEACRQLADDAGAIADSSTVDMVVRSLAALVGRGWQVRGEPGGRVVLARDHDRRHLEVEVVAEPQPWLGGGDAAGDAAADAGVLGLRLQQWVSALQLLPATSPGASAAGVAEQIMRARASQRGRGAVVTEPGALPDGVGVDLRIQPPWTAARAVVEEELDRAEEVVWLEQECPQLASAGMLTLGYGRPHTLTGLAAAQAAATGKAPFGLWRGILPAGSDLTAPEALPLPHPCMRETTPVQAWLTTEDLAGLCKAVRDGGAGLQVEQLRIDAAVVWPAQGRLLEAWATRLREAREQCAGDPGGQAIFATAAADYIGALAEPWDSSESEGWHFQPAWAGAVAAHIRFRGRRAAMRISREYRLWPIHAGGAAMVYALPRDETTGNPTDLADTHTRLGRLVVRRQVPIRDDALLGVALADTGAQVAEALTTALNIPAAGQDLAADREPRRSDEHGRPGAAAAPAPAEPPPAVAGEASGDKVDNGAAQQHSVAQTNNAPPPPNTAVPPRKQRRSKGSAKTQTGGVPAAVLHADGLWFPDGSRAELPEPLIHVGHLAELAYAYNLGYRLAATFVESAQIWITEEACIKVGIDLAEVGRRNRARALRRVTAELEFVTAALADGWTLGGEDDDHGPPGLGAWTLVRRDGDKRPGVLIALIPGMDPSPDEMPLLADEPSPAQVARRLHLLADALGYPWKFSGQTTGLGLMKQVRPRTWNPREWLDVVLAPSTTTPPYDLKDTCADFNWCRPPTSAERRLRYLHAYDRGGSYPAALAGLELPIGEPIHHPDGAVFDAATPGYWLAEVPEAADWRLPYILNPAGMRFNGPKWVCTPAMERAVKLGYEPEILEAVTWPRHGRILVGWYERFRDAATTLDTDDPDAQAARNQVKVVRTRSFGMIASAKLAGKTCYSPERWLMGVSKANANIIYRITQIGEATGCWPLAVHHDTVVYACDDPDPVTAWPGAAKNFGRGFGQYKPEGSTLLADHLQFLDREGHKARGYTGKDALIPADRWRKEMLPTLCSHPGSNTEVVQ